MDRTLREVLDTRRFETVGDLAALVPSGLPGVFTTADLAVAARIPRPLAQQMAFCLRAVEIFAEVGRARSGIRYSVATGRADRVPRDQHVAT